jgi:hypothetical protein
MLWKSKTPVKTEDPSEVKSPAIKLRELEAWEKEAIVAYELQQEQLKIVEEESDREAAVFLCGKLKEILRLNVDPASCKGGSYKLPGWDFDLYWGRSSGADYDSLTAGTSYWGYRIESLADLGGVMKISRTSEEIKAGIGTRRVS